MTSSFEAGAQHVGTFWLCRLDRPLPVGPTPRIPTAFMHIGSEGTPALAQAMAVDEQVILQRLARGCHCYAASVNKSIVAYCWVTFDKEDISELGLSFSLKAGEAYIWDCATLPAYRGQRLYPALLHYILTTLQTGRLQRIWIGADADNLASQSGLILVGFQPVADYLLAREPTQHRAWLRGHANIAEQDILNVHAALFGNHEHETISENSG